MPAEFVTAVAFSPDSSEFLVGTGYTDGAIHIYETATGTAKAPLTGHRAWVSALRFEIAGTRLFSASADSTIRIWDWSTRKTQRTLRGHADEVHLLEVPQQGNRLLSYCKDGSTFLWDLSPAENKRSHRILAGEVARSSLEEIGITEDARFIVGIAPTRGLNVWDAGTGQIVRRPFSAMTNLSILKLSPSGRHAIALDANRSNNVVLLDVPANEIVPQFLSTNSITGIHPNLLHFVRGDLLIQERWPSSDLNTSTRVHLDLWDLGRRKVISTLKQVTTDGVHQRRPTGRSCLLYLDKLHTTAWINLSEPDPFSSPIPFTIPNSPHEPMDLDVSPDMSQVFGCFNEGVIAFWDLNPQTRRFQRKEFRLGSHAATFLQSGRRAGATSNGKEAVKIFDTETHQEVLSLAGVGSTLPSLIASPKDRFLLAVTDAGILQLWQAQSLDEIEQADKAQESVMQRDRANLERCYLELLNSRETKHSIEADPFQREGKWLHLALLKTAHGAAVTRLMKPRSGVKTPDDVVPWMKLSAVQLLFRQTAEYERSCEELVAMTETSDNPLILQRVVASCSRGNLTNIHLKNRLLAMARKSVELSVNLPERPYMLQAQGAVEYRLGLYEQAEVHLSLASEPRMSGEMLTTCDLFRALVLQASGKIEEARVQLRAIQQNWANRRISPPPEDLQNITLEQFEEWHDVQATWLVLRELVDALESSPAQSRPR